MSTIANDYFRVEEVLQHRREQSASVKGKYCPFRVEFRYRGGTRHYQYFPDIASAETATDHMAGYSPMGRARIERPLSQVVQQRGTRGGWSRPKPPKEKV
jgi:hypothetical protein